MLEPSDAELVRQILAGDPSKYQYLVERYQQAVFNTAYRLVGNRASAADISQDTFLRAYKALASFRLSAPMKPWLCKIASNLSLNWLKRQRPTVPLENQDTGLTIDVPDTSLEPQDQLLKHERQAWLHRAILSLAPEERTIIELRHFQEQSYQEIADSLQLSLANVKVKLFRARKKLAQVLREEAE